MYKQFIKHKTYPKDNFDYAPTVCFRKCFIAQEKGKYTLSFCALGIGYCYINGQRISNHLFLSPVSDYRKTLWYNVYDVTGLIKDGENEIFVEAGNGFYNEGIETVWGHHKAAWRGQPTVCLSLCVNDNEIIRTDESWQSTLSKRTIYNQLRSGEYFDSRTKEESDWQAAELNAQPPQGEFRLCDCQPIIERERLTAIDIYPSKKGWIFDFGKNISGYAELSIQADRGVEITLAYAEEVDESGELQLNGLGIYQQAPFQVDKLICNGEMVIWKPQFTYHGFRYVEVCGLQNEPTMSSLTAIFTCQDVEHTTEFLCSDEGLNKLYKAGILSTQCNMFYSLTDCPTREKLGWTNDAQASLPQLMFNFDCHKLLKKWLIDICETQNTEGDLAGIAPSPDWGYGDGPVCNGIIFVLPYLLKKYYGDEETVKQALPFMKKYYAYFKNHMGDTWLGDWTGSTNLGTPISFIEEVYWFIFSSILCQLGEEEIEENLRAKKRLESYLKEGKCIVDEQTAISVLIVLGFGNKEILAQQLIERIVKDGNHLHCGMFGVQFLYKALDEIGRGDLAYSLIMNKTAPSFYDWLNRGATTLWETFDESAKTKSKNHHMFSNVIYFLTESICGIRWKSKNVFEIRPSFISTLNFAKCERKTKKGEIATEWQRTEKGVVLKIKATGDMTAVYQVDKIYNEEKTFLVK